MYNLVKNTLMGGLNEELGRELAATEMKGKLKL